MCLFRPAQARTRGALAGGKRLHPTLPPGAERRSRGVAAARNRYRIPLTGIGVGHRDRSTRGEALTVHLRWRSLGEVRRRTKVIGRFPGETSCLSLRWAGLDLTIAGSNRVRFGELDRQLKT
jgi:hypothetical protein